MLLLFFSGCALTQSTVSPSVTHDFIELDKIARISKFRSGYGHDFSYVGDETCRSMKHYFLVKEGVDPRTVRYTAPFEGIITDVRQTTNEYGTIESQFAIRSKENSNYYFVFFHVALDRFLVDGSHVSTGQFLGTVGHPKAHGEIAVEERSFGGGALHSWFDIIDTELSHDYADRGVNKENVIIPKAFRDAHQLVCDENSPDGRFIPKNGQALEAFQEWQDGAENWVELKY